MFLKEQKMFSSVGQPSPELNSQMESSKLQLPEEMISKGTLNFSNELFTILGNVFLIEMNFYQSVYLHKHACRHSQQFRVYNLTCL